MPTDYTPDLAGVLALVIQFVLPLLVGLVTTARVGAGVKAVLLLLLTAVTQLLTIWASDTVSFDWRRVLWQVGVGFVISVAAHFGLWRPVGASAAVQAVGSGDTSERRV